MRCKLFLLEMALIAAISLWATYAESNIDTDDSGSKYAWGENIGWLNLKPSQGPGVYVGDDGLTGYIWGENIGWISLSCLTAGTCATTIYGVQNDENGTLSGYAWGENTGWINFAPPSGGVSINACGEFGGTAWGENIGWISFHSEGANPFRVTTAWLSPLDNVPPVTSYAPLLQPWYKSDAVFNFSSTDCGRGTKEIRYRINDTPEVITAGAIATATVSPEACNMLEYYSIDIASNVEPSKTIAVCIDKTPPAISISTPVDASTYYINQQLPASFSVSELLSGIASITSTVPIGSVISTAATGTYAFNVTATDNAGNTAAVTYSYSVIFPGNMDPGSAGCRYAWAENVGWINFKPSWGPGVTVSDTALTGMAWGENIGWVNLSPGNGGVVNNGNGKLSGYAWGENIGWINFNPSNGGVSIGSDGQFMGKAWGENIGWISFNSGHACVKTAWAAPLDTTPPAISLTCPGTVNLNAPAYVSVGVTDDGSGVASQSVPNGNNILDTSIVGVKTLSVTAADNAGNIGSTSCTYHVSYDFQGAGGFGSPLGSPATVNTAKAGSTIPVKWQLPDGKGGYISDISVVTSITYQQILCSELTSLTNEVVTETSGSSGLRYDAETNQFIYNWKTEKYMTGSCYAVILTLNDGKQYQANFSLK